MSILDEVDAVAAITDLSGRTAAAATLAREADAQATRLRAERNIAMLTLARPPHSWKKAKIIRLAGISRGLLVRQEQRAPALLPEIKGDPEKVVARTIKRIADCIALAERAREIRDAGIDDLLANGTSNADVARLTGLPTARIAQLRHPLGA